MALQAVAEISLFLPIYKATLSENNDLRPMRSVRSRRSLVLTYEVYEGNFVFDAYHYRGSERHVPVEKAVTGDRYLSCVSANVAGRTRPKTLQVDWDIRDTFDRLDTESAVKSISLHTRTSTRWLPHLWRFQSW